MHPTDHPHPHTQPSLSHTISVTTAAPSSARTAQPPPQQVMPSRPNVTAVSMTVLNSPDHLPSTWRNHLPSFSHRPGSKIIIIRGRAQRQRGHTDVGEPVATAVSCPGSTSFTIFQHFSRRHKNADKYKLKLLHCCRLVHFYCLGNPSYTAYTQCGLNRVSASVK